LIAAAILLLLPIAAPAAAQRDASYAALVDQYASITPIRSALPDSGPRGATALRDAIQFPLAMQPRDRSRPLVLLFTDGCDTTSWLSEDAVIDSARRVGVVIHAIHRESDRFLDRLVESSGGRTWSATSDRQLKELFTRALEEMRATCSPIRRRRRPSRLARAESEGQGGQRRRHGTPGVFRVRSTVMRSRQGPPEGGRHVDTVRGVRL
jgi:hypothetical protein